MSRRDIRRLALQALYQIDLSVPVVRESTPEAPGSPGNPGNPGSPGSPGNSPEGKPESSPEVPPETAEAPKPAPSPESSPGSNPGSSPENNPENSPERKTGSSVNQPAEYQPEYPSLQHDISRALYEAHQSQDSHDPEMPVLDDIQALSHMDEKERLDHLQIWCDQAAEIACLVWQMRGTIDPILADLADEWPLHRQPPLDRSIMRLCGFEMLTEFAPMPVPIHEAVELAKSFCQENSANFVNGVLDGLARKFKDEDLLASRKDALPRHLKETAQIKPINAAPEQDEQVQEDWLSDALDAG